MLGRRNYTLLEGKKDARRRLQFRSMKRSTLSLLKEKLGVLLLLFSSACCCVEAGRCEKRDELFACDAERCRERGASRRRLLFFLFFFPLHRFAVSEFFCAFARSLLALQSSAKSFFSLSSFAFVFWGGFRSLIS